MANRYKFIHDTAVEFFNATSAENVEVIQDFLDNDDVTILAAVSMDGEVLFQNAVPVDEHYCLLFYKIPNLDYHNQNTQLKIGMLTLEGGLAKSIYNSLQRVFSPYILKKSEYSNEVKTILQNLHSNLGLSLGLTESGILSIQDEINFWQQKTRTLPTKADREAAKSFAAILDKINQHMKEGTEASLNQLDEFIDVCQSHLDEIWRLPNHYPQNRMASIFDLICNNLASHVVITCTEHLTELDVWDVGSIYLDEAINHVKETLDSWYQTFDSLTRLFWPNYEQHAWIGEPYSSKQMNKFRTRFNEILEIKNSKDLLYALFFDNDEYFLHINDLAVPFKEINIYDLTPLGNKRWEVAKSRMETSLAKVDENVVAILKQQIYESVGNPRQAIHVFNRYKDIFNRPYVMKALTAEREQLFQNVPMIIRELRELLTAANYTEDEVTPIVSETRWYRVVEQQIGQLEAVAAKILSDREGFEVALKKITGFREEIQAMIRTNFESWTENSISAIREGELSLRENQPVVIFDKTERQLMKVTFGPKIVTFCDEARHLQNLGLKLSPEIQKSITHSMKFISYARRLQQIATFHNTIGDRMIPCQRPIMLKNAMEFANLVKSESVSWNDEDSVERYINSLQDAVKRLSKDNNQLTDYHEQAKKSVLKLMETDLIRQSNVWKDEMRNLREIIFNLERQSYTNLNPFKLHWDHQLYKVLEYQYVAGLLDVHQKLPDIHLDLVFRQQHVQFRPTLEEVKSKYYSQLRRFIEKPLSFKGLSEQSPNIFKVMIERNAQHFSVLYEKAEIVFRELIEFRDSWLPWVALGIADMEQLCTVHCTTWQHWDNNFRACKKFSQQVARIQTSEKEIDCLIVNYAPLCSDIDAISRRYWEALANSLRTSILDNIAVLQEYLAYSFQVLQNIPQDELGISESSAKYEKIVSELPKMTELMKSLQGKDGCLAGWCKERVSALNGILTQWNELQPLIENHQTLLQGRLDIIKENILRQINELNDEAEKFSIRWESTIRDLETNENADMTLFRERQGQWKSIIDKREKLQKQTEKFNIKVPEDFDAIFTKLELEITEQGKNWEIFNNFLNDYDTVANEEWTIYRRRPHILVEFLAKWEKPLDQSPSVASSRIVSTIERYKSALPQLNSLQSDALIEKHWAKICQMLKIDSKSQHDLCLGDVLAVSDNLQQQATEIQSIVRQAASEHVIRQAIVELEQWSATAMLKLVQHTDSKGSAIALIKDYTETLNKIGDNQFLLQSAKNSASFESFSDQADIWEEKLNNLDYIITHLNQIQKKWIYLEPIFGVGTLKREEAVFKSIDKNFRYIMKEVADDPRVVSVNKINNVVSIIETLQSQISRCQNALSSYITSKRNAFSRFYFLSDDDLLEILGQSSKEAIIQKHIRKLFPGIYKLIIEENGPLIVAFCSEEGDELRLTSPIAITLIVEDWLSSLVVEIKSTLKQLIKKCLQVDAFDENAIREFPMQVICLVNSINFTRRVEKSISGMQLSDLKRHIQSEINQFSALLHQNTDSLTQIKLRSLLIDLVYQSTTVDYLSNHNVTNLQDWYWLQQLKFYQDRNGNVIVKMVYAEFEYSYEFLGNYNKLVYTSLAHNCYLILTQAMQLGLGGNPFGPAGTGKTECVKSLGAMFGRLVLVFNCDENIDTAAMALILSGLARCGAWGCFDEFNRLQEATLSAISMLIQPLQVALKDKQQEVQLNNESVPLNHHCCVFVTLNPAGEEYGGRQQLPLNLQALFRPIAMQAPRPQQIARVTLFVEGFKNADRIGSQIVELFELSNKMLSKQRHYDWGLRELKAILSACGSALKIFGDDLTYDQEAGLAVNVIRSNTMSRLTLSDCKRFDILLSNVFPSIQLADSQNEDLRTKIMGAFSVLGYQQNNRQVEKCLELAAQLQKRMGVVVIGPPRSGKSTIISILKEALISQGRTIRAHIISPKSMSRVQLLGKLDPDTRQWTDGVLTSTAVAVNAEPRTVTSWIICDGDIDPEWIEALNSVLDDNRLLTLPSGWRIQFGSNVNFIFETHDLSTASPATISRMGIINLNAEDLPYQLIINAWLAKHAESDVLKSFLEQHYYRAIDWIEEQKQRPPGYSTVSLAEAGLVAIGNIKTSDQFCVNLLCGLNGVLNADNKNKLANQVFSWADVTVTDGSVAEYHYYNSFRDMIELYSTDEITGSYINENVYTNVLVKTPLMKLSGELLKYVLEPKERQVALLIGPSGNGKSLLLQTIVSEFNGYQLVTISCSAQLTTSSILSTLKQNSLVLTTVKGKEYRPKFSRIVLYLKNIDLCSVDSWGTCEVVELLLQLINRSGFYSESLEWISVSGIQICASVSNLIKAQISPRFLSICHLVQIGYPNNSDMESIVKSMILPIYNQLGKNSIKVKLNDLARAIMNVYFEIQARFNRGETVHYRFTPKMIERWVSGVLHYPEEYFSQALRYECNRIFRDRLVTDDDRQTFDEIVRDNFRMLIDMDQKSVFVPKQGQKDTELQLVEKEYFSESVSQVISMCNSEVICVDIPMSEAFLDMVSSMVRALSRPQANLVLCGRTGSCRLEALYVGSFMLNIKVAFPQPSKNYTFNDFNNDLKTVMQNCAIENEPVVFYIDHSVIDYLGDVMKTCEAILEGADLSDFFGDDLENLANPLKAQAALESSQLSLSAYFLQRLRNNFHLVILLEYSSPRIRELFENYSALYQKSEMVWILEGRITPVDSLARYLGDISRIGSGSESQQVPLPVFFNDLLDNDLCQWSRSPKRRVQLVRSYQHIYESEKSDKEQYKSKIQIGVDKLSETHKVVEKLKLEAQEKQIALTEKRKLANQSLEMISTTMRGANDQKTELLELQRKTQESSVKLMERKKVIEEELSLVEPILKEASAAVGQIKTEALSEIRSLRAPPETVRDILEGVLRLMGIRDTSWNSMKTFLAKRGVKEDIRSLDPVRINPENCQAVEKLLQTKAESYDQKNAKRASAAAAPLAAWVMANVKYSKVIQSIKPLEREQNELRENLEKAEREMKSLSSGLDNVNDKVKELSEQLNVYTQEAAMLEIKLEDAKHTLHSAEVLVQSLSSEYVSWSKELEELNQTIAHMDRRSFLTAFCITHLSDLSLNERKNALDRVSKLTREQPFDLDDLITNQDKIIWESMGLTADQQYRENAIVLNQFLLLPFGTTPIPLLVDPTELGQKWFANYLNQLNRTFELTSQSTDRFSYILELAIRFGKILIIRNVNAIEPPLLSLFFTRIHSRFNKRMVQIGNKLIDLHDDFKLILVTQNEQLDLGPELQAHFMNLMFTTTIAGLTDVLTFKWVLAKDPEIEKKRVDLLQEESRLTKEKRSLQDRLLQELSSSQGDILKNEPLLNTLNGIKTGASSIEQSLNEFVSIRDQLMEHYNRRREFSSIASRFYMGIRRFYGINVSKFTNIFLSVIDNEKHSSVDELYKILVRRIFSLLSRSILKDEQMILGLNVCKQAFPQLLPEKEWESFVFNFTNAEQITDHQIPSWIKQECVPKVLGMKQQHPELYSKLNLDNVGTWQKYIDSDDGSVPIGVSDFQPILVAQVLRPDLLIRTITRSVQNILGLKTLYTTRPSIKLLSEESLVDEPLLLIASSGIDPSEEVREHAKQTIGLSKYAEFTISKGHEMDAMKLIKEAATTGGWVCIKNVHTVPQWLRHLDEALKSMSSVEGFKLWLTSETDKNLNEVFVKKCNKVLYEPPTGLKYKMKLLLDQHGGTMTKKRDYKSIKMYLGLFMLHSIVQERRSYVPQGWSKWYDFSDSDLRTAMQLIKYTEGSNTLKIHWPLIQGLCEKVGYGGRIDNDNDFEKLEYLLREFFDEKIMTSRWQPMFMNVTFPNSNNLDDYLKIVERLPDTDTPNLYGIPASTNASRDIIFCRNTLKELRQSYFSGVSTQNYEKRVKPIISLWSKLMSGTIANRLDTVIERNKDKQDPWMIFVLSELAIVRNLYGSINGSLQMIKNSLKELATISAKDRTMLTTICDNQVPLQWRRIWSGPKTVIEYLKAIGFKTKETELLYNRIVEETRLQEINFNNLFNVEAFLTTMKMIKSEELKVSTTELKLCAYFDDRRREKAITIAPLLIDGGYLKDGKLVLQQGTQQLAGSSYTGNFSLDYIASELDVEGRSRPASSSRTDQFEIPLYNNISRDALICQIAIEIGSGLSRSQLVAAGVAYIVPESY